LNFLMDLEVSHREFRRIRLQRIVIHLVDLLLLLDKKSVDPYLIEARDHCETTLAREPSHVVA
jgi:hypothetical protein